MKTADGFAQTYNAQAAVEIQSRLAVSAAVSDAPNDKDQLVPTLGSVSPVVESIGAVLIFTPDKAGLRANIAKSGDRALALDLDAAKRERKVIQLGQFWFLRRGRAFARAVAMMFARRSFIQKKKQTISV